MSNYNGTNLVRDIANVQIFCKDIEVSKKFYTEVLGFKLYYEKEIEHDGQVKVAFLQTGNFMLNLIEYEGGNPEPEMGPVNHFGVNAAIDIDELFEKMKAQGIRVESEQVNELPLMDGIRYFCLRGPDDERVEIQIMN